MVVKMKNIIFHTAKSKALTPQKKIDPHNLPFTLNTAIGCLFGCRYCYVQGYPFNMHAKFGEEVKVKLWIAEQLNWEAVAEGGYSRCIYNLFRPNCKLVTTWFSEMKAPAAGK